ncbi:threonine synthase [Caulobacter sp. KR2-114]|uniref:threonine synthase n=1 Tax=Caulobacter sp. KR2-114 TaxID=3400912 RepID=UPI003C09A7C2
MKYVSTRGEAPAVGFLDAVLSGLAPDGGLYVPETWPQFSAEKLASFAGRPYAEVAAAVISAFADGELSEDVIAEVCAEAYASFAHDAVTPLRQLAPGRFLLELFHGPTLAFKDVAMQLLARLYDHALGEAGRTMTIVCATSGDTGGAAVEAFRGRRNVRIVAMFPDGRISPVQRRFMTTVTDDNVRTLSVAGDFDDCQAILKGLFQDAQFAHAVDLSAVNSINFARIAAQAVYYFVAAAALGAPHRPVSFVIPTGNFGDAFAGYVASRMGLPIERMVVATNSNDIVARAVEEGRYAKGEGMATQSPAMDIQVASNFERLYFEGVARNGVETGRAFRAFAASGAIDLPPAARAEIARLFRGVAVDEAETSRTILATLNATGALVDPHTAVALAGANRVGPVKPTTPVVVLSTAHPAKFPEAVYAAAGVTPAAPPVVQTQAGLPERFDSIAADAEAVKTYVRDFVKA